MTIFVIFNVGGNRNDCSCYKYSVGIACHQGIHYRVAKLVFYVFQCSRITFWIIMHLFLCSSYVKRWCQYF